MCRGVDPDRKVGGGTDWCVNQPFPAGGVGGAVSPPAGSGSEPRKRTHFGKNLLKINLKSGLISVARQCMLTEIETLVGVWMLDIENDKLVTSLVYCAIYAQLPVSRIEFIANRVCNRPTPWPSG